MDRRELLKRGIALGFTVPMLTEVVFADSMSDAQAIVDKYAMKSDKWDGPTTGPKAQEGKTIVILAGDMKNGGILGSSKGAEEACAAIGWTVKTIDGAGSVEGRASAFGQALALNPNGIIVSGFDTTEQATGMAAAKAANIPVVTWHSSPTTGPSPELGIFANVTTDPMQVSTAAAMWAYIDAKGKPGCIYFTDSTYAIAIAKAKKMQEVIEKLGGTTVEWVDTPIAETSQRMPQLTTALLQKHGEKWTHSMAINDLYFDFMGPSLNAAGIAGSGQAPSNVSAGDGSESAYQRIRSGQYQAATVAEPLNLQGWQLVDELNRAMAGEAWSGYISPLHVVTKDNVEFDGGPNNGFDPGFGYQNEYKKIWGKM
jgi:ribose transport system substrate-binding protein